MSFGINSRGLQILNIIAVLATIIVNALANIVPFNGVNTGQVADSFFNYFTPAGYVFAIWGVIYVLQLTFMFYQARKNQSQADYVAQIGVLYFLAALANIIWLVLFHYSYGNGSLFIVTMVPIIVLLLILILTYVRLGIGKKQVTLGERLAVQLPVSVYLGWISVATIANTASALNVLLPGIALDTQYLATAAMIMVALVLVVLMLYLRHDYAFGLVFAWASAGIGVKHAAIWIINTTALGAAVVAILLIVLLPFIMKKHFADFYMIGR